MAKERLLINKAHAAAAAAKDILTICPDILKAIREAASAMGCDHKLSSGIGTPVNADILQRANAGSGSQLDRLHAKVDEWLLTTHGLSVSRSALHRTPTHYLCSRCANPPDLV